MFAALLAFVPAARAQGDQTGKVVGKITITEADGNIAQNVAAVVYVVGFREKPVEGAIGNTLRQKGRRFIPDLVGVTEGELVSFPNEDPFLHNVFSPSPTRKFDLGSFKQGETKTKQFADAGVVDVFCNIHPEMAATVLVLPNHKHTNVRSDGSYMIPDIPPGEWTLYAYTRRAEKPVQATIVVTPGAELNVDLTIARGPEPEHVNKYGEKYRDGDRYR